MKHINLTVLVCLGVAAFAQEVQFDYDRSANFSAYKTYQWVDYKEVPVGDQILDQDIKRAVDAQLAGKGLRRVESDGDLLVGYQAAISQEKQFDSLGWVGWSGLVGRPLGQLGQHPGNLIDHRSRQAGHWAIRSGYQATRVARLRVEDARHQEGSRQELPQSREGDGQAVQELSARRGQEQRRCSALRRGSMTAQASALGVLASNQGKSF